MTRIRVLKSHTINESKLFSVDFLSFGKFQIVRTDLLMCIKNLTMFIPHKKKITSSQPYLLTPFKGKRKKGRRSPETPSATGSNLLGISQNAEHKCRRDRLGRTKKKN